MKKTLEEVAKSEAFEFKVDYKPFETDLDYREYAEFGFEKGFIAGAEYQAERRYSENDMIGFGNFCINLSKENKQIIRDNPDITTEGLLQLWLSKK